MGDKPYTEAVKQDIFSQFFESTAKVTIFSKKPGYLIKMSGQTNSRYISKTFSTKIMFLFFLGGGGLGDNRGFLDCFLGTKVTTVMCE